MTTSDDALGRGEELDMRALEEILGEWVEDGDNEKAARAIMGALPIEIGEAICDLKMNEKMHEIFGNEDPDRPLVGGPSISVAEAFGDIEGELEPVPVAAAPRPTVEEPFDENTIELVVTDQAFEPSYGGWNVQFQAVGAPRLAHQNTDPCLEAFVKLDVTPTSLRLESGQPKKGSALVRAGSDDDALNLADVMLGGGQEGAVLRGAFGAAMVEEAGAGERHIPLAMPDDAKLLVAMRASLEKHLEKVREERARMKVTDKAEAVIGRRFRMKL